MEKLTLYVKYLCRPGVCQAFVEELEKSGVADKVRAEEGCLRYQYYYPANESDAVFLLEQWESAAHQEIHMTQPHMEVLRAIKHKYVIDTLFGEKAL